MKTRLLLISALMAAVSMAFADEPPPPPGIENNEDPHPHPPPLEPEEDDSKTFRHFIAHNSNQTCSADSHARPFNNQIRGVNLGGWMVLEPWITPSLFYQFLGGDETNTAFDTYTFCEVLGPEEGNKQLRRHWDSWVTEEIIQQLADSGAVNSLRLPVGDFMYKPYGPYSKSNDILHPASCILVHLTCECVTYDERTHTSLFTTKSAAPMVLSNTLIS